MLGLIWAEHTSYEPDDMVKACAIKNMIPTRYTGTCFVRMHGHTDAVALMAGAQDHRIDGRQIKVSACWDADIEDVVQLCCDVVIFPSLWILWFQQVQWASSLKRVKHSSSPEAHPSVRIQGPHRNDRVPKFRVTGARRDAVEGAIATLQRGSKTGKLRAHGGRRGMLHQKGLLTRHHHQSNE